MFWWTSCWKALRGPSSTSWTLILPTPANCLSALGKKTRIHGGPSGSNTTPVLEGNDTECPPNNKTNMELNTRQMEAVTSESRRLLILAGPGTGKTETLTERIAHFIESKGLPASRVLMFTYTNKAANNMSQRVRGKLSVQADLCSGTF